MDICNDIIWYNSINLLNNKIFYEELKDLPGYKNYLEMHNIFAYNYSVTDRYNSIELPIKTKILPISEPVEFQKFSVTYEEICINRAKELLEYSKKNNKKIYIMYSGGIDSTAIVCSFLAICNDEELKKYILIALSENSIIENKNFYYNFLLKKFNLVASDYFQNYLCNDDYLFITGENNDQILGFPLDDFINKLGFNQIVNEYYNDAKIIQCLRCRSLYKDDKILEKYVQIFNKIILNSPVKIETVFEYFWWITFCLKWQDVYIRMATYSKYPIKLEENYTTFFATKDFQLWSLNNKDKRIKDSWNSYKYICKDFIYSINKDIEYRNNKKKCDSLGNIIYYRDCKYNYIDINMKLKVEKIKKENWNMYNEFI